MPEHRPDHYEKIATTELPSRLDAAVTDLGVSSAAGGRVAQSSDSLTDRLASMGYWPARAQKLVRQGKYASAVELCKEHLTAEPELVSGRVIYATALYLAGQTEPAAEQFYAVLSRDPDNLVALKYLGDIKYAAGDELTAMTYYQRVQTLDPDGRGLACPCRPKQTETTRTVTIKRPTESKKQPGPLRKIPFYTETIGDLYLDQGYPRLAAEVYRVLHEKQHTPRLADKLARAEEQIRQKER